MKFSFFILFIFPLLFLQCRIKEITLGETEIKRTLDSNGVLISYQKIRTKSTRLIHHPHNPVIVKTKTKNYKNGVLIEFILVKRKRSMSNWKGEVILYKRKRWDEKGKRISEN